MKKILVTGASGFVGNAVLNKLLPLGHNIVATSSNRQKASSKNWFEFVEYIPFDFKEFDPHVDYFNFFGAPDILIHLAWEGLPNYTQHFHLQENLPRHVAFIQNLIEHGLTDLTVAGTCLEYGMKEGELTEDMTSNPTNSYAIAKNELRVRVEKLSELNGVSFKWLRLFYMYGPGQSAKSIIPQLEKALLDGDEYFNMSGGKQTRDFLHIDEVANYVVKAALQKSVTGIINCASGQPITVENFVKQYLAKNSKHIKLNLGFYPYTDYEPMHFWGNINKLKRLNTP